MPGKRDGTSTGQHQTLRAEDLVAYPEDRFPRCIDLLFLYPTGQPATTFTWSAVVPQVVETNT
jgi:hypothetical protein